ncbi:hypothetical protein RDI58_020363 [Solanum bulbocastanum]|uniref:Uncharacterized protein n=1 Tax=Solanum bulbocastanum TaxID=147425 RepID=A0AAN8TCB1_SOLBU
MTRKRRTFGQKIATAFGHQKKLNQKHPMKRYSLLYYTLLQ